MGVERGRYSGDGAAARMGATIDEPAVEPN